MIFRAWPLRSRELVAVGRNTTSDNRRCATVLIPAGEKLPALFEDWLIAVLSVTSNRPVPLLCAILVVHSWGNAFRDVFCGY